MDLNRSKMAQIAKLHKTFVELHQTGCELISISTNEAFYSNVVGIVTKYMETSNRPEKWAITTVMDLQDVILADVTKLFVVGEYNTEILHYLATWSVEYRPTETLPIMVVRNAFNFDRTTLTVEDWLAKV